MTGHERWLKRLDDLRRRAEVKAAHRVPIIDTMKWPDDDRIAYATGTSAERDALIARHHGPLPEPATPGAITAIIVTGPLGPPEEIDLDG